MVAPGTAPNVKISDPCVGNVNLGAAVPIVGGRVCRANPVLDEIVGKPLSRRIAAAAPKHSSAAVI